MKKQSINVNKVYLVNLDRSKDRLTQASLSLNSAGIYFDRFPGTDGYEIVLKEQATSKNYSSKEYWNGCKAENDKKFSYEFLCNKNDPNSVVVLKSCMSPGVLGCYCSMRNVWKDIIDNNYDYALILEDDAAVLPQFKRSAVSYINALIKNAPLEWEVIFVHIGLPHKKTYMARKIGTKERNLYVDGINRDQFLLFHSTGAYIVKKSFAEKMYHFTKTMYLPVDHQISKAVNDGLINAFAARKIIISTGEESVISAMK